LMRQINRAEWVKKIRGNVGNIPYLQHSQKKRGGAN